MNPSTSYRRQHPSAMPIVKLTGLRAVRVAVSILILLLGRVCPAAPVEGPALQRVALPGALSTNPPLQAGKVKLGTSTRNALRVPADFAFAVTPDGGCRQLIFSIGIAGGEANGGRVEFAVEAGRAGSWRRVFAETLGVDASGWSDQVVTLEVAALPGESLRFSTTPDAAGGGLQPYWGSLLIEPLPVGDAAAAGEAAAGDRDRPSVILVSLDTLGAKHVGWYGREPSVSPALDAFLARSFTFRRAYAQYPNTLVSHASLFSGLYPNRHQVYGNAATLRSRTLAAIMAERGYMTVGITEDAYVSSDFGFDRGFDWYDDGQHVVDQFPGTARKTFDKTASWLQRFGAEVPFFLFVHTYEVHTPYAPQDEAARATLERLSPEYSGPFREMYPGGELEVKHNRGTEPLAESDLDRLVALHASEIQYLDRIFGRFVETLSGLPFADDTLVIVLADHGDEFGEHGKIGHGETLHNPVLHVPLAFYWPGNIERGEEDARVQLVDVAPTVLDLIGIAPAEGGDPGAAFDGRSLAPAIRGRGLDGDRPVFAELRSAWASCRELGLADDCRSEHYAAQNERFKYLTSMIPRTEELYDLRADPGETRNVAAEHPQELHRFRRLLADYVIGAAAEPDSLQPAEGRIDGGGAAAEGIDEVTRERLKALGYNP